MIMLRKVVVLLALLLLSVQSAQAGSADLVAHWDLPDSTTNLDSIIGNVTISTDVKAVEVRCAYSYPNGESGKTRVYVERRGPLLALGLPMGYSRDESRCMPVQHHGTNLPGSLDRTRGRQEKSAAAKVGIPPNGGWLLFWDRLYIGADFRLR